MDMGVVFCYLIILIDIIGWWWLKVVIDVNGFEVVVYGGYLEYCWYMIYFLCGYGGEIYGDWLVGWNIWDKFDVLVMDVEVIF